MNNFKLFVSNGMVYLDNGKAEYGTEHVASLTVSQDLPRAQADKLAHVFAAAPELLEAIKLYLMARNLPSNTHDMVRSTHTKLIAAIAKAEGK